MTVSCNKNGEKTVPCVFLLIAIHGLSSLALKDSSVQIKNSVSYCNFVNSVGKKYFGLTYYVISYAVTHTLEMLFSPICLKMADVFLKT